MSANMEKQLSRRIKQQKSKDRQAMAAMAKQKSGWRFAPIALAVLFAPRAAAALNTQASASSTTTTGSSTSGTAALPQSNSTSYVTNTSQNVSSSFSARLNNASISTQGNSSSASAYMSSKSYWSFKRNAHDFEDRDTLRKQIDDYQQQSYFGKFGSWFRSMFNSSSGAMEPPTEPTETFVIKDGGSTENPGGYLVHKGPNYRSPHCNGQEADTEIQIPVGFMKQHKRYFDWVMQYSQKYQQGGVITPFRSRLYHPELDVPALPRVFLRERARRLHLSDCTDPNNPATKTARKLAKRLEKVERQLERAAREAQLKTNEARECIEQTQTPQQPLDDGGHLITVDQQGVAQQSRFCTFFRFISRAFSGQAVDLVKKNGVPASCKDSYYQAQYAAFKEEHLVEEVFYERGKLSNACNAQGR